MKQPKSFFVTVLFLVLNTLVNAQETETKTQETLLLKVVEIVYGGASTKVEPKIIISKPSGESETKLLERTSMLSDGDGLVNYNQNMVRSELQAWQNKGFKIQAMSTASPMTYLLVTTIVMTKD